MIEKGKKLTLGQRNIIKEMLNQWRRKYEISNELDKKQSTIANEADLPDFTSDFIEEWKHGHFFQNFRANGQKGCQARSLIFSGDVKKGDPYYLNSYKNYRANI